MRRPLLVPLALPLLYFFITGRYLVALGSRDLRKRIDLWKFAVTGGQPTAELMSEVPADSPFFRNRPAR
jgi:hypothetical protein